MAQTTTNTITPTDVFFPPLFGYQVWNSVTQPDARPSQSIYQKSIVVELNAAPSTYTVSVPFGPAAPGWGNPMSQIAGVLATKVKQGMDGSAASFPELILTAACNTRCSLIIPVGPPPSGNAVDENVGFQKFTMEAAKVIFQPARTTESRIVGPTAFEAFRLKMSLEIPSRTDEPTSKATWIYSAISTAPPLTEQNLDSSYNLVTATVIAGSGSAPNYAVTNGNTQGVGVFDGNNGPTNFRFRGVAEGAGIDVSYDAPTKAIVVALDAGLDNLNDVAIAGPPTVGDVLTFDGANWSAQAGSANQLSTLTDVNLSTLPIGAISDETLTYDATIGLWTNKQVIQLHQWKYDALGTGPPPPPADGTFKFDNLDPTLAASIYVSKVDYVGRDSQAWLYDTFTFPGSKSLVIQCYGAELTYDASGTYQDLGTFLDFPVTFVSKTGSLTEPSDQQVCFFSTVSNATVSAVTSGANVGGQGTGLFKQVFGGVMEFYNVYTGGTSGLSSALVTGPGDDYLSIVLDADIGQLNDVNTTTPPSGGQVLSWDAGTSKWVPQSLPSGPQSNTTAIVDPTVTDDSSLGYSVGSTWLNTVSDQWWKCSDATIGAAVWKQDTIAIKNNSAATSPAVTDDSTAGYSVGSEWLDTTTSQWWKCVSAAVGAAVWRIDTDDYKANSVRISHGSTIDSAVVNAVVIGHGAGIISGNQTIAVGHDATVNGARAVAVGSTTSGGAADTVAVGYGAVASASHAIAIGALAQSQGNGRIAIGAGAVTTATERLALGFNGNNNVSSTTQFSRLPVAIDGTAYEVCMRATDLAFDDLSDVVITSAANGNSVIYNGTNFINEPNVFHSPFIAPQSVTSSFSPGGTNATAFFAFQVPRTAIYSNVGIWLHISAGAGARLRLGIYNGDPTSSGALIDQTALISGLAIGTGPSYQSFPLVTGSMTLTANTIYTFAISFNNTNLGITTPGINATNYGRAAGTTDYYTGGFPASLNLVAWSGSSAGRYPFRLS